MLLRKRKSSKQIINKRSKKQNACEKVDGLFNQLKQQVQNRDQALLGFLACRTCDRISRYNVAWPGCSFPHYLCLECMQNYLHPSLNFEDPEEGEIPDVPYQNQNPNFEFWHGPMVVSRGNDFVLEDSKELELKLEEQKKDSKDSKDLKESKELKDSKERKKEGDIRIRFTYSHLKQHKTCIVCREFNVHPFSTQFAFRTMLESPYLPVQEDDSLFETCRKCQKDMKDSPPSTIVRHFLQECPHIPSFPCPFATNKNDPKCIVLFHPFSHFDLSTTRQGFNCFTSDYNEQCSFAYMEQLLLKHLQEKRCLIKITCTKCLEKFDPLDLVLHQQQDCEFNFRIQKTCLLLQNLLLSTDLQSWKDFYWSSDEKKLDAEQKDELKHFRKKRKEFFRVLDWILKPPLDETFFLDEPRNPESFQFLRSFLT